MRLMQQTSATCWFRRIALFLCGLVFFSAANAVTLQEAVQQMLATHPDVLAARSTEEATEHDVRQAKGKWLPSLDAAGGVGKEQADNSSTFANALAKAQLKNPNNPDPHVGNTTTHFTRTESLVGIRQLLFDGGNVSNQIKQQIGNFRTAQFQLAQTQEARAFDAASAFLNVIRNQQLVKVALEDVKTHRDTLYKVTKRLEAGAGRKSEVTLAAGRLALSQSKYEEAKGVLNAARDTYMKVIGEAAPGYLSTPQVPANLPGAVEQAQSIAMEVNPSVAAAAAHYDAATSAVAVAKSAYFPTFTAAVESSYNNSLDGVPGHNNESRAMLRMNYNVFRGGSDEAAIRAAIDRQAAALHDTDNIRRNVNEDVALSWDNLVAVTKALPFLKKHRDDSWVVYDAYVKQYQLGQRTLFDLVNALTEYYEAKADYINGIFNIKIAQYRLLAGMGILVNTLIGSDGGVPTDADGGPEIPSPSEAIPENIPPGADELSFTGSPLNLQERVNTTDREKRASQALASGFILDEDPTGEDPPLSGGGFTVQLLAGQSLAGAEQFIARNNLNGRARIVTVTVGGRAWYRVMYGAYGSRQAAMNAIQGLPPHLQAMGPMVRVG